MDDPGSALAKGDADRVDRADDVLIPRSGLHYNTLERGQATINAVVFDVSEAKSGSGPLNYAIRLGGVTHG